MRRWWIGGKRGGSGEDEGGGGCGIGGMEWSMLRSRRRWLWWVGEVKQRTSFRTTDWEQMLMVQDVTES